MAPRRTRDDDGGASLQAALGHLQTAFELAKSGRHTVLGLTPDDAEAVKQHLKDALPEKPTPEQQTEYDLMLRLLNGDTVKAGG